MAQGYPSATQQVLVADLEVGEAGFAQSAFGFHRWHIERIIAQIVIPAHRKKPVSVYKHSAKRDIEFD